MTEIVGTISGLGSVVGAGTASVVVDGGKPDLNEGTPAKVAPDGTFKLTLPTAEAIAPFTVPINFDYLGTIDFDANGVLTFGCTGAVTSSNPVAKGVNLTGLDLQVGGKTVNAIESSSASQIATATGYIYSGLRIRWLYADAPTVISGKETCAFPLSSDGYSETRITTYNYKLNPGWQAVSINYSATGDSATKKEATTVTFSVGKLTPWVDVPAATALSLTSNSKLRLSAVQAFALPGLR